MPYVRKPRETERGEFIINGPPRITAEDACRTLLGMSASQLVREILENIGGKYDDLYAD